MRATDSITPTSSSTPPTTATASNKMSKRTTIPISQNWVFKQANKSSASFLPVAQFPTNVHLDLLAHKLISDPFIGKNELDCQWVGEVDWIYRTTFPSPPALKDGEKAVLAFDGLDTYATVVLNGEEILRTESMFLRERVDVSKGLKKDGGENELVITFESAYLRGWKTVEQHPDHKWGVWNGDISRLAVRKAQYHWGWDWGPALLTCGPWRPINLEVYESRIVDLYFETTVDESLTDAEIVAKANTEGEAQYVKFDLSLDGKDVATETVKVKDSFATANFQTKDPQLWYPARYGKQTLYTLTATLLHNTELVAVDTASKKLGLRRAELVQHPLLDQPGASFFFRINNIPIFAGGSNWIPGDNFIPRITKQKYYDWVKLVAEGNQFMLRVWGGGIYEEQAFYDACDELGILVWQDFLFGCGNYPAFPAFLDLVKREADDNVKLLRHHPSIVIWAGNNEDYQFAEQNKVPYDPSDKNYEEWLKSDFPARYIYEKTLADTCKELIPNTYYHFGSPWSGSDTTDPTNGDMHQWNVWHGSQEKYQNFDKLAGRFVSEFGMEAFPSVKTIDAFLPLGKDDPDRYPQSSTIDFHNKADGHERRIALYLVENMRYAPDPLEQFVYCTQLMQAECLASAYRLWKRQWKGPKREYVGGALVWQINDCWPVTSWAIVDYYKRPKMAYFTVKREMSDLSVGIDRREHEKPRDRYTRAYVDRSTTVEVWGSNLGVEARKVGVLVKGWDVISGKEVYSKVAAKGLELLPHRSTEVVKLELPLPEEAVETESKTSVPKVSAKTGGILFSSTEALESATASLSTPPKKSTPSTEPSTVSTTPKTESVPIHQSQPASQSQSHSQTSPLPATRTVVAAYLLDSTTGAQLARYVNWPEPLKYVALQKPKSLSATVKEGEGEGKQFVEISAEVPVKGVVLEIEEEGEVEFEDNCVDVVPGEVVRVGVKGWKGERVGVRYLGML